MTILYSGSVKLSRYRRAENTATRSYFALNFNFYTIIDLWVAYFNFREYEPEKRVQSVLSGRCTSCQYAGTIRKAFPVSSRSPVLLADDTRQIFGRSAKLPATKAKSLYSRIAYHNYKNSRKIWLPISPNEKNRLIYSRMRCVAAECNRPELNRAQCSKVAICGYILFFRCIIRKIQRLSRAFSNTRRTPPCCH